MKSLTQFIIESTMNENFEDEKRKLLKCKVFKELFKAYTDCKKPEDLEEEDFEEDTSLKYLTIIRNLRDDNEELFVKIKKLPKKIRSGKK